MAFGVPSLVLAKSFLLAQLTVCPPALEAPHADVYFLPKMPEYITNAPIKSLTEEARKNPDSTFATDHRWIVEGMMIPGIESENFHFDFNQLQDEAGNTCLYVHKVYFSILYEPTIFLGKELQQKGQECRAKTVKTHEEKHVAFDLNTIQEYMPKIRMEMLWYLRSLAPLGPFPAAQVPEEQRKAGHDIVKAAEPMIKKLMDTRRNLQGTIDTVENYKREAALCPGTPMPDLEGKE